MVILLRRLWFLGWFGIVHGLLGLDLIMGYLIMGAIVLHPLSCSWWWIVTDKGLCDGCTLTD